MTKKKDDWPVSLLVTAASPDKMADKLDELAMRLRDGTCDVTNAEEDPVPPCIYTFQQPLLIGAPDSALDKFLRPQ